MSFTELQEYKGGLVLIYRLSIDDYLEYGGFYYCTYFHT